MTTRVAVLQRWRARLPEVLLLLLVLVGLTDTIKRFFIEGKLPQPFIFDINDTFMDWFNTAYFAHESGTYDAWRSVYPPLSFVFLKLVGNPGCYVNGPLFARDCDGFGIAAILGFYLLGSVMAWQAFRRQDRATAPMRGLAFALGLPWLFTLERGNLILVCFCFFVLAHGGVARSGWVRALGLAVTINFKPYLVVPAVAWAAKRRWRLLELGAIGSVILYCITFALFGSGSPAELWSNTLNFVAGGKALIWEQVYYSTSYAPFADFNTYRFPTRDFIASQTLDRFFAAIPVLINGTRALVLLVLLGAWLQPQAVATPRLSLLAMGAYLVGQSPGGYAEAFLIFLLFLERWQRPGPIVALIAGYLLCVTWDLVLSNVLFQQGDSWLSGRPVEFWFGISVGIFLRPALVIVMVVALAIDSLQLIARAHRAQRPTLAMRPALGDGRQLVAT